MSRKPIKTGREFEQLVTCINKHLHKIATVTHNDKLPDKDNGDMRQVDISVRISDGPSKFLGIIEVRDRGRPVGMSYVEEVSAKKVSVGANGAWIVSKSGFWKSAKVKADALGIGVISYKQALKADWSEFFHLMEGFGVLTRRYDKIKVFFLRKGSQDIINPHAELRDAIRADSGATVLLDAKGAPAASLGQIAGRVIESAGIEYTKTLNREHLRGGFGFILTVLWNRLSFSMMQRVPSETSRTCWSQLMCGSKCGVLPSRCNNTRILEPVKFMQKSRLRPYLLETRNTRCS